MKGAKGLLVNITGGKDLKLFEVDEAVNKVRAEVDPEAELIIGAITDPQLDGTMRVSIVATALDGQQPEAKSVINMVHRIQNRNPGYSDFTNMGTPQSFNFNNSMSNPVSEGATALKLENEVVQNTETNSNYQSEIDKNINSANDVKEDLDIEFKDNLEVKASDEIAETKELIEENNIPSNGLENFGIESIEEETPELFNSDKPLDSEEFKSFENSENSDDEEELEIPAFLRRQKN